MPENKVLVVNYRTRIRNKLIKTGTGSGDWVRNDGTLCLKGVEHHKQEGEENVCC